VSLKGRSIQEISDKKWEDWKASIDADSDKRLVVLQYYDLLRCGNYSDAYSLLYDRKSISREDFVKAASGDKLPVIDFAGMEQYKEAIPGECYFMVEASLAGKTRQIIFDLKRDPADSAYGGWKIYKTRIKIK
jgi:hypothetical protein